MCDAARLQPQRSIIDERGRLRAAITRARSLPGWGSIPVVFIPENGPPGTPSKLWEYIKDMTPIICMAESGAQSNAVRCLGVPKTQESTLSMKDRLVEQLADGSLGISDKFFSLEHIDKGQDNKATLDKLRNQMYTYRALIKKKYGEYWNDDLLISVMQALEWSDRFIRLRRGKGRPDYEEFHRRYISRY